MRINKGDDPEELSIIPPSQKAKRVQTAPGSLETASLQTSRADPVPWALTSTVLLIRPVPTVILPVTFPPVGDAVAVLTAKLKVAGAVWGFRGVFCREHTHTISHFPAPV